ncbi:hypothetical protein MLD38_030725 [Melastoma candidum]|uniref:Uncharacterized protein n=1 Tax=Melastoma candidum TaxID=119954 RepID=A0ACB9MMI7_9MYRT|nr:hypothetical protein MLD38_030725 [Melastoma candidum]
MHAALFDKSKSRRLQEKSAGMQMELLTKASLPLHLLCFFIPRAPGLCSEFALLQYLHCIGQVQRQNSLIFFNLAYVLMRERSTSAGTPPPCLSISSSFKALTHSLVYPFPRVPRLHPVDVHCIVLLAHGAALTLSALNL